jgi:ABC-2 type transport system ATP-binding protein
VRGEQLYVHTTDSDRVARYLLTETDAHDVEITAHGLEDAFLSLTGRTTPDPELEGALR